jgi:cysteinyl-tRNA synthetase
MRLYNTLNKQIEDIVPINAPRVTVYTCGPTVYDYAHIGNWFTFVRYDLLVRALKASGLQPTWVMNITDVGHLVSDEDEGEDKLEKGARRENKTAWDVAAFYGDNFVDGLKRLNFTQPDYLPKATEHIAEQIALVKTLEDKGFTYVIDDGVYFDTAKFPQYADFAQLDTDEQQAGKRVEFNTQKRNSSDFALWKLPPKDQKRDMEWESPWGVGFPGWHLECSAMSMKYLGETIDIHSGGIDHIPVHHTNEIAQSEAATGKRFTNYWMHTNHISIAGDKISKSLGNAITLDEIEDKGYELEVLRLHIIESHYRSQSKFSWESLEAAKNRLQGYRAMAALQHQPQTTDISAGNSFDRLLADATGEITSYMQDDLNTPQILAKLNAISDSVQDTLLSKNDIPALQNFLKHIDSLLGLKLTETTNISDTQHILIQQREQARKQKDWTASDQLRDQLLKQGISLRDTSKGTIWFWA